MSDEMKGSDSRPPNVILILADDLGYGDLGCYGNDIVRTPHLDALARDGMRFDQHYAEAPICAPSRAGMLTGRHHHRCGAVDVPSNKGFDRIAVAETTMADAFQRAGYETGMIGKWHTGLHDLNYHPNARGFREFMGFLNGGMDYWQWVLDYNGTPARHDGRYLTDVFSDEAVSFIERHREHPFFLHLSYNAPHPPMQAPADVVRKYMERGDLSETVALNYAMIEIMDAGIGRIRETLGRNGLAENTIVIFTSDNGAWLAGDFARFNGPFRGMKQLSLEGGIRVPAMVAWPGRVERGAVCHEMINSIDWFPTLLALTGNEGAGEGIAFDGVDLSALLRGETKTVSRTRYWQFNRYEPLARCNGAMRDGPWKLYFPYSAGGDWKYDGDNSWYQRGCLGPHECMPVDNRVTHRPVEGEPLPPQLFHIGDDPGEARDLAAEDPNRVQRMTAQWDAWWEEMMRDYAKARADNLRWLRQAGTVAERR
ncbi:MAG: sulfatase-like hydrolase/transferase [Opitutales bacterium]|nr:sulfatase-like hydrolase/transferase [Opitutales bacterium]